MDSVALRQRISDSSGTTASQLNAQDSLGNTPAHLAATQSDALTTATLIALGSDILGIRNMYVTGLLHFVCFVCPFFHVRTSPLPCPYPANMHVICAQVGSLCARLYFRFGRGGTDEAFATLVATFVAAVVAV